MKKLTTALFLMTLGLPTLAEDFFGTVETTAEPLEIKEQSPWSHKAWLQQKTGYGYRSPESGFTRDSADLTRTETQFYGELDWRKEAWQLRLAGSLIHDWLPDFERAGIWSGYEFTQAQEDARSWRWEVSDSFVSWQKQDWWLKGGYQTLAWGEAETLKVTDVLARRDQRWPGQEDLEDLRLPVPALRVSWNNRLDLVLLPEMPLDRNPAAFEEFDPYIQFRGANNQTPDIHREEGDNPGWALRWQSRGQGLDTQFLLADVYSFDVRPTEFRFSTGAEPYLESLTLEPWRQQIAGLGVQSVHGNWLLKTEQAWHRGVHLMPNNPAAPWIEKNQWRAMVSSEYSGVDRLRVSTEFSWNYTQDYRPELAEDEWQTGLGLRANYTLFNERLSLTGVGLRLNGNQGDVVRLSADWELTDEFSLALTLVEYSAKSGDQLLYPYRHNDSLLLALRWGL